MTTNPTLFLSKTGFREVSAGTTSVLTPGADINGVLFTGASNIVVAAAAGTLTGTTLASNVVTSSITTLGNNASLPGNPTTITQTGGTNNTTIATTAFVEAAISGLGTGSVTNFSFTNANGISGVVSNPTTTPDLTLSLGAITPSSVSSTFTGNLTGNVTGDVSGNAGTVTTISGLITQGTNITITGAGTSGSPYNISAASGSTEADFDQSFLMMGG